MTISGVQSNFDNYQSLSTGKKINSGADDAAGLAIAEKMTGQINGYIQGTDNAKAGQDLLKVAEAGLGAISDSLQRMRELSLQATNMTYSDTERKMIQEEINQLKIGIQEAAAGTEYNTLKLLDGSMADIELATNPSGSGMKIQMENATLKALGIEDFDVTSGNFSIEDIDKAISKVNASRATIGGASSALEHVINNNTNTTLNLTSARSQIEDEDIEKAITDLKKNELLEQYKLFAMKEKQETGIGLINRLFT